MVETRVDTDAPVEAPPRALLVRALSCWLRTASAAAVALLDVAELPAVPGDVALVVLEVAPPAAPPEVALDELLAMTKAPPAAALDWVPLTVPPVVEI